MTDKNFTHHVLIVEDDAVTRARMAAYFETENYRVSQSEDGEGIHRLIAESAVDVLLLDINLPGKDEQGTLDGPR